MPDDGVEIVIVEYDPAWVEGFERERARIVGALDEAALAVEHVGSTAVPGLAAKPSIDICLLVADSADETSYVPALERAGYELHIREPDWHEHRMLRTPARDVHVHVFTAGSSEVARMLAFRDRLRTDDADRALYAAKKRELAGRRWPTMQHYADAKTDIVDDIMTRAPGGVR